MRKVWTRNNSRQKSFFRCHKRASESLNFQQSWKTATNGRNIWSQGHWWLWKFLSTFKFTKKMRVASFLRLISERFGSWLLDWLMTHRAAHRSIARSGTRFQIVFRLFRRFFEFIVFQFWNQILNPLRRFSSHSFAFRPSHWQIERFLFFVFVINNFPSFQFAFFDRRDSFFLNRIAKKWFDRSKHFFFYFRFFNLPSSFSIFENEAFQVNSA